MNNKLIVNSDNIRKVTIEKFDCKFINYSTDQILTIPNGH